jgi:DNA-binding MarR family transcriptional regulator
METTWGIVDILIIAVRKNALLRRRKELSYTEMPLITNHAALSLVWLEKNPRTDVVALSDFLRMRNGTAVATAEQLKQRRLIHFYRNGAIQMRRRRDIFIISEIFAFEAKLRKWQTVVKQAERHLWFTNKSYVVMPCVRNDMRKRVTIACKRRGLGFITMEAQDHFKLHQEPLRKDHNDGYFRWKLNEFLLQQGEINGTSFSRQTT